jgi:HlyD family secretion protein
VKRWAVLIIIAIIIIAGIGYLGFQSGARDETPVIEVPPTVPVTRGDVHQTVTAPGRLIDMHKATLSFDIAGKLVELNVKPGDAVQAGDVLARLDTAELELQLAQAEQAYLLQQAVYSDTLQADPDAIAAAQAALASADAAYQAAQQSYATREAQYDIQCVELKNAQESLARAQTEFDAVANDWKAKTYAIYDFRKQALANAQRAYDLARARCDVALSSVNDSHLRAAQAQRVEAQNTLNNLTSPAATTLLKAEADLENARLVAEQARRNLEAATLVAPFDGVVLEVHANVGEAVGPNSALIVVNDAAALEVEASVIEEDLPLVRRDQPVDLFFDAVPEALVSGRVARIVPQRAAGDRPLYPIYIAIDDLPAKLFPGMTVDASIVIDSRSAVLRLPRAVVRARSDDSAIVKVWLGDHAEERTVQIGLRGDQYVEILNGLREGDQVVSQ